MAKEKNNAQETMDINTPDTSQKQEQGTDTPVMVDMAAMMQAVKAELKAEMEAEAKAAAEAEGKVKSKPMTAKDIAYWDEPVEYSAPFVEGEEDITVGHNGTLYKIKRGETVTIPRKVRQVILDSEKQKVEFAKLKKGLANQELQA